MKVFESMRPILTVTCINPGTRSSDYNFVKLLCAPLVV